MGNQETVMETVYALKLLKKADGLSHIMNHDIGS